MPSFANGSAQTNSKTYMALIAFKDQNAIVVGEAMPCSVYGADRKLLVAKGVTIANERMREAILAHGAYQAMADADTGARELPLSKETAASGAHAKVKLSPAAQSLLDLRDRYNDLEGRSRFGLRIARDEKAESVPATVIGVVNDKRCLILTWPIGKDENPVPIREGEVWLARLFNATTVFRFLGTVLKVAQAPIPHLHLGLPANIERRMVRRQPRALSALRATQQTRDGDIAIIVDLSVSGARIAVNAATTLTKDARVDLFTTVGMVDNLFELHLTGKVSASFGVADSDFPDVRFFGVQFDGLSETAMLVLHGYVHEQLVDEFDRLSRVLAIESAYNQTPGSWLGSK
jgi:hypothetical protein